MTTLTYQPEPLDAESTAVAEHAMRVSDLFVDLTRGLSPGTIVRRDEPLARRTTLRVGGPVDLYVEPQSESDLTLVLEYCKGQSMPWFVLGRGSNLLVRDGGVRGLAISLAHQVFSQIDVQNQQLICGAGARLKAISQTAKREGLGGLEFLEGIPGTLGGAMRMNAGAMGAWTFHVLDHLRFMDPNGMIHESAGRQVGSEYRSCPLFHTHIALGAVLSGKASAPDQIRETLELYNRKRWESQPPQPSAGCTFKNPAPDLPAGRLIDELGLKQYRSGNAMVSDVHANFIVNLGGATARDVLRVIEEVQTRARCQRGIDLHVEVEILGED